MKALAGTRDTAAANPAETPPRKRSVWRTIATTPVALFLILLMAVGSVFLWIGVPVGWLYLASRMVKTSQPTLGPYLLVIFGIPVTMVISVSIALAAFGIWFFLFAGSSLPGS